MPVRSRSADDLPRHTPSFVCEVPLRVSRTQERTLLARLEAARQAYNACLGEARRRVRLVRRGQALPRAPALPRDDAPRKTPLAHAPAPHPSRHPHPPPPPHPHAPPRPPTTPFH